MKYLDNAAAKLLQKYGVKFEYHKDQNVIDFFINNPADSFDMFKEVLENRKLITYDINKNQSSHALANDYSAIEFTGCTTEDIIKAGKGEFDKTRFLKMREAIGDAVNLNDTIDLLNARRRARSFVDTDGELDFDRMFDFKPFHSTKHDFTGISRNVEIYVPFDFNCFVSKETIDKYGVICWAVIDLLERNGIQCKLISYNDSEGMFTDVKGQGYYNRKRIYTVLKDFGQYTDPLELARCFFTGYFRRCIFNTMVLTAEATGHDSPYGLGAAPTYYAKAEKGRIDLALTIMDKKDTPNWKMLDQFIKTAILGKEVVEKEHGNDQDWR